MALDAAIHPQEYYSMGYPCKDIFTFGGGVSAGLGPGGGGGGGGFDVEAQKGFVKLIGNGMEQCCVNGNWDYFSSSSSPQGVMQNVNKEYWDAKSSPELHAGVDQSTAVMEESSAVPASGKRKRQRTRASKNKEELENQRMTHIAVERNRRKQMNDYLAVIRSLMPPSYVQRGDQASIIGGAINFVKELEQYLQSLEAQKRTIYPINNNDDDQQQQQQMEENGVVPPIFADFFTFPQYSTTPSSSSSSSAQPNNSHPTSNIPAPPADGHEKPNKKRSTAFADIEVSMAESHANLKILSKKRPRQLLKIVSGLQCLWFTILHLNVTTTFDQRVLYSISVKVIFTIPL
ncbi:OLC1v1017317C1 [Oldenlandia corymbosa var. corymbosa]|uniref:OLC1v1017317C1 n=1 Tax=Oldenlandia corymbosa var. corymbosa TaxID=529605 RepID=A0AAV1E959_OLDCO|nr:OLC1v1017317C1 [Oldenlandia corymbosa var. corymbosa]